MAVLKFHKVSIRNFLSYGNNNTVIQLDQPGTTLITGEDLDNTSIGAGSNGVGKTTLINAVTYAVYDKPVSNISKDNLVNNINKKNLEVCIEFTAPNGLLYRIVRTRKSKSGAAGNTVHVYENDKDITPDSVSLANDLITKIVGIPYELFVRIVVFSAAHTPFLDLPSTSHYAANQRDIIEELFGLTALTTKANQLKDMIKDSEGRLATNRVKIESLEREHQRHKQQIITANARVSSWELSNTNSIRHISDSLKRASAVNIDEQKQLHTELNDVKHMMAEQLELQRKTDTDIKNINKKISKLSNELTHLHDDQCPYCLQAFSADDNKLDTISTELKRLNQELVNQQTIAAETADVISDLSARHSSIKQSITVSDIDELISVSNQSSQLEHKLRELSEAVNPYNVTLDELLATEIEPISYDEVNKITKEIEHQKFLLKLLTKKDSFVRKTLLNKNIPFLNQKLSHYLTIMGLPHKVEFTHEMTASISQFGQELDFGNLSAGQRARVNLALSLAFGDVLQNMHTKINICMLDEALDHGLDTVGVQAAIKLLKRKSRDEGISMYIISHRDVDTAFDRVMTVQLSNGFSYIKQPD